MIGQICGPNFGGLMALAVAVVIGTPLLALLLLAWRDKFRKGRPEAKGFEVVEKKSNV